MQVHSREQAHKRVFCSASLSKVGGQAHRRRRLGLAALLVCELHRLCEALVTVLRYTTAVTEEQAAPLCESLGGNPDKEVCRRSDADSGTWPSLARSWTARHTMQRGARTSIQASSTATGCGKDPIMNRFARHMLSARCASSFLSKATKPYLQARQRVERSEGAENFSTPCVQLR